MKFERIKANNWIRGKKEVEELLNEDARKDGRDENNRGNSSFQSGESINGSPQVVGQYLTYPRLEYQLGHSTVARMGGKSDKLWKKSHLPLSFPRPSATIFTIQCYLPDTYAKRKTINKRANLIQLSSINNTTYISIHPPSSENVAEVTRRRLYLHYIHHYPSSSTIESLPIKTCQLSYNVNCILLQEILVTVKNNQMLNGKSERFTRLHSTKKLKSIRG